MTAADGETGLEIATAHEFDAIVLDIGLPKLDGYALMRALRERARMTPVLMLTARDAEDDIIHGLDVGADDYMTKPFSFPELVARLQSITRSQREEGHGTIRAGDVVVDPAGGTVTRKDVNIQLTRHEFLLLTCLLRRAGECVPRQSLIECIWGADHPVGPTTLDVLVNALRAKIDAPYRTKLIVTVRGTGYLLKRDVDAEEEA
jgi:DNA-binding response OmpR family regulator